MANFQMPCIPIGSEAYLLKVSNCQKLKTMFNQKIRKETIMKTLVKTNGNLFPAIPSLIEDFLMRDLVNASNGNWKSTGTTLPAVNVGETNEAFIIEVAAPGMKRGDFNVELDNNVITISSQNAERREEKNSDGAYSRREFSYQSFQRSFALPENKIEGEKITAKYVDGILYIAVPKKEEAKVKPPKQISIS